MIQASLIVFTCITWTTLKITSEYEAYIGKEFTNIDKLNELVKIMEGGQAKTISQAIDIYKSQP